MNDVKLIIQLTSILIVCVIYVGIWCWVYDNRDEYLYIYHIQRGFMEDS